MPATDVHPASIPPPLMEERTSAATPALTEDQTPTATTSMEDHAAPTMPAVVIIIKLISRIYIALFIVQKYALHQCVGVGGRV